MTISIPSKITLTAQGGVGVRGLCALPSGSYPGDALMEYRSGHLPFRGKPDTNETINQKGGPRSA